ncbi:MAG: hypothetical protein L6V95_07390 [Candidatus Melainabacteria bacterium]|nr:MAG: hypothetical protein L6V95_07390 [Candidatus Melainabacteria bacterium]
MKKAGNKNKSLNVLKSANEINPNDKFIIYTLASTQKNNNMLEESKKNFIKLIQLDENNEENYVDLADIYVKEKIMMMPF